MMFLLVTTAAVYGHDTKGLIAGEVSPATSSTQQDTADSDDTGEVDEDIIITDEVNTNDDEGFSN